MVLVINTYAALKIFFLFVNEQKTNFQRKQLPNSAAVAEYASKPHVVVKLQSQVFFFIPFTFNNLCYHIWKELQ